MPDPGWHRAVGDPECFLTYAGGTMHGSGQGMWSLEEERTHMLTQGREP
jgi:hypothetical protein